MIQNKYGVNQMASQMDRWIKNSRIDKSGSYIGKTRNNLAFFRSSDDTMIKWNKLNKQLNNLMCSHLLLQLWDGTTWDNTNHVCTYMARSINIFLCLYGKFVFTGFTLMYTSIDRYIWKTHTCWRKTLGIKRWVELLRCVVTVSSSVWMYGLASLELNLSHLSWPLWSSTDWCDLYWWITLENWVAFLGIVCSPCEFKLGSK